MAIGVLHLCSGHAPTMRCTNAVVNMSCAFHNTEWNVATPDLPTSETPINEYGQAADNRDGRKHDAERHPNRAHDVDGAVERHRADEYDDADVEEPTREPAGAVTHDDTRGSRTERPARSRCRRIGLRASRRTPESCRSPLSSAPGAPHALAAHAVRRRRLGHLLNR
jgi:hypothetical protein